METTDQIRDMISSILDGNNVGAQETFNDIAATKVSAALDDRKIELAQTIFNKGTEENA
jgi:hypothetical protein